MSTTDDAGFTGIRLDAAALRVLAHPLRSRLLSTLRRGGPATATALAATLGTNSGATSYHLRKLESVGLVADTGEGEGKRRLWRAATDFHSFDPSDFAGDEDSETALNWLVRDYIRHLAEQFERWLDVEQAWPMAWRDAAGMSDSFVIATPEQLQQLKAEVDEVLARYRRVGQGNPEARRVAVYSVAYPIDLDRAPRADSAPRGRASRTKEQP
ncbi:transcriptional regulator, ArsR family [Pedococcus cremeus]|uniref:Transcriptional regulator, ArsR family n=1 Tax=Pedococcus cremeus TaxID=587636 RepID=A0A1H9S791_9MICO|nr:helix-turn-helix domain-containing protein [Pedococcus cremeus]SER80902.1 transcriptional regulator, ArsR family [Pedococcus cremeus]